MRDRISWAPLAKPLILERNETGRVRGEPSALAARRLALAIVWQALQPHLAPARAEAGRDTVTVNLERIGGRHPLNGIIPVQCGNVRR